MNAISQDGSLKAQLELEISSIIKLFTSFARSGYYSIADREKKQIERGEGKMDNLKIGQYIQHLRKATGMTQKELADKLNISFQAVSKWENGDSLPDVGILVQLCDVLNTTTDKLLNGGNYAAVDRRPMHLADVKKGFECIEAVGELFGENSTFFTGMIEGINTKMNIDLLSYLKVPTTREVMYAEVLIQGILSGRSVDITEIEENFENPNMVEVIRDYLRKTDEP